MDIRSIALFCEPQFDEARASAFFAAARDDFPYRVQTTRLATPPFPDWWGKWVDGESESRVKTFAAKWRAAGADYISMGPVQLRHERHWCDKIPAILKATDVLFVTGEVADCDGNIDVGRCHRMAGIVQKVSTILDNGFANLYLAALANCPPGSPFFPIAYHAGGQATFAVAVECADLALTAVKSAGTLMEARSNLISAIEKAAAEITIAAESLTARHGIPFHGIDFSLAPFPTEEKSVAAAMEALGLSQLGAPGSLFAAAFMADAISRANFPRCGFSGLMLPVLEDSSLALRAGDGLVTIQDLLSYAAVCGVGLDTVPLPGDIKRASLTGILLDVAALATRLNKPLTARLLPIPGLRAGDAVQFDFPYFADSRIMRVAGEGVGGLMSEGPRLHMHAPF